MLDYRKTGYTDPGLNDGVEGFNLSNLIDNAVDKISPQDRLIMLMLGNLKASVDELKIMIGRIEKSN